MKNNYTVVVLSVTLSAVLGLFGFYLSQPAVTPVVNVGASSGTEHTNYENFYAGTFQQNVSFGGTTALTSVQDQTITATALCYGGILTLNATTTYSTTTLPVAANILALSDCMPSVGSSRSIVLKNLGYATTTAAFAGTSTSTILQWSSATTTIVGGKSLRLIMTRDSATTILFQATPFAN